MSDWVLALSAQSSANRKSRPESSCTFVFACDLQGLKILPSVRWRRLTLMFTSEDVCQNGGKHHTEQGGWEYAPLLYSVGDAESSRLYPEPSHTCRHGIAGHSNLAMISNNPPRQTVRSTKVVLIRCFALGTAELRRPCPLCCIPRGIYTGSQGAGHIAGVRRDD